MAPSARHGLRNHSTVSRTLLDDESVEQHDAADVEESDLPTERALVEYSSHKQHERSLAGILGCARLEIRVDAHFSRKLATDHVGDNDGAADGGDGAEPHDGRLVGQEQDHDVQEEPATHAEVYFPHAQTALARAESLAGRHAGRSNEGRTRWRYLPTFGQVVSSVA